MRPPIQAPYDDAGNLLRVATPGAAWRPNEPFTATMVVWDIEQCRYLVLCNMATRSTYPVNWTGWWPYGVGQFSVYLGRTLEDRVGRPWADSTSVPGDPPADWPLIHYGGWAQSWCVSWTGRWIVAQHGRTYALHMLGGEE